MVSALKELTEKLKQDGARDPITVMLPDIPVLSITPRDAFYAETEVIPIDETVGRTIAEFIMVYPPGIPIFIPGEIITKENIEYIKTNIEAGLPVQGPEDYDLRHLRVIKEHRAIR